MFRVWGARFLGFGFTTAASMRQRERIFTELLMSDRKLKAFREGSQ